MIHLATALIGLVLGTFGAVQAIPTLNLFPLIEGRGVAGIVEANAPAEHTTVVRLGNGNRVRFTYDDARVWLVIPGSQVTVRSLSAAEIKEGDRIFLRVNDALEAYQVTIERL